MPRTRLHNACLLLPMLLLASPAASQTRPTVVTPSPPPREGTVGPEQLRDFSLPGTNQAQPAPDNTAQPPAPQPQRPAPATAAPVRTPVEPPRRSDSVALPQPTPPPARATTERTRPAEQATVDLGSASAPPAETFEPVAPAPTPAVPQTAAPQSGGSLGWWPWLAVAALAGVALAFLLRRRSRGEAFAVEPEPYFEPAQTPEPALPPRSPAPAEPALPAGIITTRLNRTPASPVPAPASAPAGGIVSTGLRPWVDVNLDILEVLLGETEVEIRYRLLVANSGAANARAIIIEALGLNAGENQAQDLSRFFARPEGSSAAIEVLPRLGATDVTHVVRMPRASIQEYEVQGRRVFVPILAFNVSYAWNSGSGRTGAAFLVGLARPGSDRLAPLRLDAGVTRLTGLSARRLDEQVRR